MIKGIEQARLDGDPQTEIENLQYDSRLIKKNGLFVAVTGFERDGYDFVDDAGARGAVAVMGERDKCDGIVNHVTVPNVRKALADVSAMFYGFPGTKIKVCGVTGTNGKTTTCHLIKRVLEARSKTAGLVSSVIYDTGGETFPAERTTPESLDLQRLLLLMKENNCVNAVIEVSSHAIELHRIDNVNFRVVVYTNISRDHLDFHKTMESYLDTKGKLLKKLEGPLSYAVINLDVPEFRRFFGDFSSSYISYSLSDSSADVYCATYKIEPGRTVFDLVTPMGIRTVDFPLPGKFNLMNGLAAASAGLASGVDLDNIVKGLEAGQPVPGRFHHLDTGQPFTVYIDYAHTPDAIVRLCEAAREMSDGRLLILFGCGGDRDKGKRPMMGEAATKAADFAVVTSDNPRREDPMAIIEDIRPGLEGDHYEIIADRSEAIAAILRKAESGDIVLLAGKGAEDYQEIGAERTPFSDEQEARRVLGDMGFTGPMKDEER